MFLRPPATAHLDPTLPLINHLPGKIVQLVVERSFGWLAHWGGLLRDRAGCLDVSAARIACAAVLSGVEALLNPMPVRAAAS